MQERPHQRRRRPEAPAVHDLQEPSHESMEDQLDDDGADDQYDDGEHHPLDTLPPGCPGRRMVGRGRVRLDGIGPGRGDEPVTGRSGLGSAGLAALRRPRDTALGAHLGAVDDGSTASVATRWETPFGAANVLLTIIM
jgi:hypothetical protein